MSSTKSAVLDTEASKTHDTYLNWLANNTPTMWWHDSADPKELQIGLERGAVGVTTNPVLAVTALKANRELWGTEINKVLGRNLPAGEKAEALLQIAVTKTAEKLLPEFKASKGERGHVCAQVSPLLVGDREKMVAMARRLNSWAPNICVKLPASGAGIDAIEACAAEGISTNATVSFTLAQLLAVGEQTRAGVQRAKEKGVKPAKSFATMMIGRLDDYLREVAHDNRVEVTEDDIQHSGMAVVKRAYAMYRERGYETMLLVAALRGTYHLTELAGGDLVLSVHPSVQDKVMAKPLPRERGIHTAVAADTIARLSKIREFVRAYEPDGMTKDEFIAHGTTQRTVSQFIEVGWKGLESYK
jgi:transaldolase